MKDFLAKTAPGVFASDRRSTLLRIADAAFLVYLAVEFLFAHTLAAQCAMALFCIAVLLLFLDGKRAYFSRFLFCYALLIVWGLIGLSTAVDRCQAAAMVKTLAVGLVFFFYMYQ